MRYIDTNKRHIFRLRLGKVAKSLETQLEQENLISPDIAAHVRGGDYLNLPNIYAKISSQYYKRAKEYIKGKDNKLADNLTVCTNDLDYARTVLKRVTPYTFIQSSAHEEFNTMIRSKNIICTNSTFSICASKISMLLGYCKVITKPTIYYNTGYSTIKPYHKSWIEV